MKVGSCVATFANYEGALVGFSAPNSQGFVSNQIELKQEFAFVASESALTCATTKGNFAAFGGTEEVVKMYDLSTKKSCGDFAGEHTANITSLAAT